jgi:hypothetical protein
MPFSLAQTPVLVLRKRDLFGLAGSVRMMGREIPPEICLYIYEHLELNDILNFSVTCRGLYDVSTEDVLWRRTNLEYSKSQVYWPLDKSSDQTWRTFFFKRRRVMKSIIEKGNRVKLLLRSESYNHILPCLTKSEIDGFSEEFTIPFEIGVWYCYVANGEYGNRFESFDQYSIGVLGEVRLFRMDEILDSVRDDHLGNKDFIPLSSYLARKGFAYNKKGEIYYVLDLYEFEKIAENWNHFLK